MNQQNTIWVILGLVVVVVVLMWFSGTFYPTAQPQAASSDTTGTDNIDDPNKEINEYGKTINYAGRLTTRLFETPCPVVFLPESATYEPQELIEQLREICNDSPTTSTTTGSLFCIEIKIYCPPGYEQVCTDHGNDCALIEPTSGDRPYDDAYRY